MRKLFNVLYINTTDIKGGAAKVPWNLAIYLKEKIISNFIVGQKFSQATNVNEIRNNVIEKIIFKILGRIGLNYYRHLLTFIFSDDISFGLKNKLFDSMQYKEAEIVHLNNLHGDYFNLSTLEKISNEKPVVWTLHDEWALMPHGAWNETGGLMKDGFFRRQNLRSYPSMMFDNWKFLEKRKRNIYNSSKMTVVVPSKWLLGEVLQSALKNSNIKLIYNGINIDKFKQLDKKKCRLELGLPTDKKIVTFLASGGKANPQKGWIYAKEVINKFKNKKDVLFLCIGGGDSVKESNIQNVPYIKSEELLAKYYSAGDIFLFTSVYENFPLVVLEAMSCGLPVVAFDVGGTKEAVLHKKCGYVAKYKNVKDVCRGLNYVLDKSINQRDKISQYCQKRVRDNFTSEIMANKYYDLYLDVLKK